jgi:tetratricopeptide (TPR) repeat protein
MKFIAILFAVTVAIVGVNAQKPPAKTAKKPVTTKIVAPVPTPTPSEKTRFDAAVAIVNPLERAAALRSFLDDFPESSRLIDAGERLVAARADGANSMLQSGQPTEAVNLLKTTVNEAPNPISQKLFSEAVAKFPMLLFLSGQRAGSAEIAALIENRVEGDAGKLLTLANFFLATENSTDALRLATRAVDLDPASAAGQQILGLAHRLNFDIESSINAYNKALELEPNFINIKRSLAQLLRASGRPTEALELARQILAADDKDAAAQTIEVLSLFDLGKKADAEAAFDRSMKATPGNVALVAGVAYWYAANGDGPNAVLHAEEAVDLEPRFVWGHIALGRGLMLEKKYAEAEQALIKARKYGKFPSLEYAIASARVASGFYREAAEDLRNIFSVKDGRVETHLGGRINRSAGTFTELLADERRASIFEPRSADHADVSTQLANLLAFDQVVNTDTPDTDLAASAATKFANGGDTMQLHRQLYAASVLLEKRVAPAASLELTRAAMSRVDDGISVPQSSAAVMAAELYDARRSAFLVDQFVLVPPIPKPVLSAIVRGRIEETAGWALFEQQDYAEAEVRLKRAITVLPADSAWWRSSMWRLGTTLVTSGKDKEALDAFVASYKSQPGSGSKYLTIRSVYQKVNGNTDELEKLVGPNPVQIETAAVAPTPEPSPDIKPTVEAVNREGVIKETSVPSILETPQILPPKSTETQAEIQPVASVADETKPTPSVIATPIVETKPTPTETAISTPTPSVVDTPRIDAKPTPTETATPTPTLEKPVTASDDSVKAPETNVVEKPDAEPAQPTSTGTKAIFDPIIITIPDRRPAKPKPVQPVDPSTEQTEKPVAVPEESTVEASGAVRPRVIDGVPEPAIEAVCTINVSQSNVSLVNAVGSVAILVGTGTDSDTTTLTARSSSPDDVEVIAEPAIEGITGRSLYLIRSKSSKTGVFQVTFQSTCGKKEVIVRVR